MKHFATTIAFWGCFAALEGAILVPLAHALGGQGEGAAVLLIVLLVACIVGGAVVAVPRYNAMLKALDKRM